MPKSVLPRGCRNLYSPAPLPPSSLHPREARARARGSTIFETFKAQNVLPRGCRNLHSPAPLPPSSLHPREARARARGSTIFETFKAQNAEICTPPRLPKSLLTRAPAPQLPAPQRGQSAGAGEYDFRDFQSSKCRNLYSPAPVPPSSLDAREAMRLPNNLFDVLADAC